jgi:hypothetical protein
MKLWNGYGSEHSANLVMIGRFKNATTPEQVKAIFDQLTQQADTDRAAGVLDTDGTTTKYSDPMLALLGRLHVHSVAPWELEQFLNDVTVEVKGQEVVLTTQEYDVSAFLKVLIDHGARVDVFSAHDYKDSGYGR